MAELRDDYYPSCLRAFIMGTVPSAVNACSTLPAASAFKSLMNAASTNGCGDVSDGVDCLSRC